MKRIECERKIQLTQSIRQWVAKMFKSHIKLTYLNKISRVTQVQIKYKSSFKWFLEDTALFTNHLRENK